MRYSNLLSHFSTLQFCFFFSPVSRTGGLTTFFFSWHSLFRVSPHFFFFFGISFVPVSRFGICASIAVEYNVCSFIPLSFLSYLSRFLLGVSSLSFFFGGEVSDTLFALGFCCVAYSPPFFFRRVFLPARVLAHVCVLVPHRLLFKLLNSDFE